MSDRIDVLGLGCAAVDDVLHVARFPAADAKERVSRSERRFGGLTGAALVTAARMGASCAYAGCLGPDESSAHIAGNFAHEGISLDHAPRLADGRVVHSVIVVGAEGATRNIFFEAQGRIGAHETEPGEAVLRRAKVLFIDQYGMAGNLRAARLARDAGAAVVADFEDASDPLFDQVLALVDHLVLSASFALPLTGRGTTAEAATALWRPDRAAVVITCGAEGCWSLRAADAGTPRHHPAFPVRAQDTTGCGDVFHGAYAARLAAGEPFDARIRFASAAAALKAARPGIPRRDEVERFLLDNPPVP